MSLFRRHIHEMPGLNTASLPDLIFSVLFFFMIVTHMRKETLKVEYRVPQGTELTRLTKKSAVSYVHIGRPISSRYPVSALVFDGSCIQLNDKYVTPSEIIDYISAEKSKLSPEDQQLMTVSIKADKATKMSVVNEVKQALRQAKALKINYSATEIKK
ncbi:biopolymer transporter ExbD [Segatella oris]|uniref:ExbD/TolR family protein n=1 Tax=Segatella oris TaxID=28135 RepID=UPI0028EE4289|nr:biopolymer transporter ExbD [Segatella oris]